MKIGKFIKNSMRTTTAVVSTILLLFALTANAVLSPTAPVFADSTAFFNANQTVASNSVTNPDNGWTSNNQYATFNAQTDTADYGFADLGIPSGVTIDGIEVTIEGYNTAGGRDLNAALWKTSAYTTAKTATLTTTDTTYTLGGPTDKWGTTWTVADFADATFKIRVGVPATATDNALLDAVQVKVYYTPNTETYTTAGTTTWTAPTGVTSVTVEVWGGGGKGGNRSGSNGAGGGGGGGAYSKNASIPVTPGNSYTVVVGAGATNASGTTPPGGTSYFISAATISAIGGASVSNNNANGASGGAAASGVGETKYSGGNGANGATGSYGGGGGGGAGSTGNGGSASGSAGGTGTSVGGGNGGNGPISNVNGVAGSVAGGGGSGALRTSGTRIGGSGADGQVRITYKYNTTTGVTCTPNPVTYGSSTTCVATVTRSGSTYNPSGTVTWASTGAGSFGTPTYIYSSGSFTCTISYTPTAVGTGSHTITATYSGDTNFNGGSGNQVVTVNKKALTVTGITANNKIYDGGTTAALNTAGATLVGVVGTDVVTLDASGYTANFADKNVGTGKAVTVSGLALSGANKDNYTLTQPTGLTANITTAPLTITANADTKTYNGLPYSGGNGVVYSGFVNGETSAVLSGTLAYSGTSQGALNAGSYVITPGGLTSSNYAITFVNGTLTVNMASQTITFGALPTKNYGDADFAPGATASSGLTVSYSSSNTSVATIVIGNIHIVGVGTSTITALQTGDGNYSAATPVDQTLTVTIISPTITIEVPSTISFPTLNIGNNSINGTLAVTVSSGTNWHVTANTSTSGHMINGTTPLSNAMRIQVQDQDEGEVVLSNTPTTVATGYVSFSGNISFKQEVTWDDEPGDYQIVVTFIASVP